MAWQIDVVSSQGATLETLDTCGGFSLVRTLNAVGSFTLRHGLDRSLLVPDHRFLFKRDKSLELVGFLRRWRLDGTGMTLSGPDQNVLLKRRLVAYYAGTTQAQKSAAADDLIKEIIAENLGASATDTDRDLTAAGLTVQGDLSQGPTVDKSFAYANVLRIFQEAADVARSNDSEIYFAVVPTSDTDFQFRTWTGQWGRDRRETLTLSEEMGNLTDVVVEEDYSSEVNFVYAGGQGEESARVVVEVWDPARLAYPWGRCEAFADARQATTTGEVEDVGRAALLEGRPRLKFAATLLDCAGARYGVDWNFGERVRASAYDQEFDCLVRTVKIDVDAKGNETITARLECDLPLGQAVQVNAW